MVNKIMKITFDFEKNRIITYFDTGFKDVRDDTDLAYKKGAVIAVAANDNTDIPFEKINRDINTIYRDLGYELPCLEKEQGE